MSGDRRRREALRKLPDELHEERAALAPFVAHYLSRLAGPNGADAVLALIERPEVLPVLEEEFGSETDPDRRRLLIHCIWQFRNSEALPTLAVALDDPDDRVWKEALDGLVSLGGHGAVAVLQHGRASAQSTSQIERVRWIEEAIRQLQDPGEDATSRRATPAPEA